MLPNPLRGSNILSPSIKDLSRYKKAQIAKIASPSKLSHSPSLGSLRKNKQINLPTITVNNLDKSLPNLSSKSPLKSSISTLPDDNKTSRVLGYLSPIIKNRSSFFNMVSPNTNIRASQFKPLNLCFSPAEGTTSPDQKLSQSTDSPQKNLSESPEKYDTPRYQAMTLSGVGHITGRIKKENSRKFIFSKPQESPRLINLEPLGSHISPPKRASRLSSDSRRSSESPDTRISSPNKLEVCGQGMGHAKKKSIFFTKKSMENLGIPTEVESPPKYKSNLIKDKPRVGPLSILEKKRVSSILTKELEARYGVQLRSPEISDDENEESKSPVKSLNKAQGESPAERLQDASTQATILWNASGLKVSTVKSTQDHIEEGPMINFEELTKGSEPVTGEIGSGFTTSPQKSSKRREIKSLSSHVPVVIALKEFKEGDVFQAAGKGGKFFKINKSNKYIQKMNQTMTYFGPKSEPFLDDLIEGKDEEEKPTVTEPAIDVYGKSVNHRPMITQIGNKKNMNQIVQPEFMERNGTMCVTEFWSQKKKKKYAEVMTDKKIKHVTILDLDEKRKDEVLYKPKKWKEENFVQAQMKRNAVEGGRQVELAKEEAKIRNKIRIQPVAMETQVYGSKTSRHLRKERSEPFLINPLPKTPSSQNLRMLANYIGRGDEMDKKKQVSEDKLRKMFENSNLKNKMLSSQGIQKNMLKIFQEK